VDNKTGIESCVDDPLGVKPPKGGASDSGKAGEVTACQDVSVHLEGY
jgi:hypothetical protein